MLGVQLSGDIRGGCPIGEMHMGRFCEGERHGDLSGGVWEKLAYRHTHAERDSF